MVGFVEEGFKFVHVGHGEDYSRHHLHQRRSSRVTSLILHKLRRLHRIKLHSPIRIEIYLHVTETKLLCTLLWVYKRRVLWKCPLHVQVPCLVEGGEVAWLLQSWVTLDPCEGLRRHFLFYWLAELTCFVWLIPVVGCNLGTRGFAHGALHCV